MQIEFTGLGIHLPEIGLWLDPQEASEAAWLSHAHSDHARGVHGLAIGTPVTLDLYEDRWPEEENLRRRHPLAYGEQMEWGGAKLTCYPAGHILGAAQLLVEYRSERLVYTGDIKLRTPLCGAQTEVVPCDRLIMECTFGLPVFAFLSREQAAERILAFAKECLDEGATPAYLGYPLGRGQEIVHVLTGGGVPAAVHGAIARYLPYYEREGFAFPGWMPYDARQTAGRALVVVPGMRNVLEAWGKDVRVAYVSGWARFDSARTRSGADELIPYSDHAGFDELIELVELSGARRIDLVHGYTEAFAGVLRARGYDVEAHDTRGMGGGASQATQEDAEG